MDCGLSQFHPHGVDLIGLDLQASFSAVYFQIIRKSFLDLRQRVHRIAFSAHEDIDGGKPAVWPGVDGDMAFGQNQHAGNPLTRPKTMKVAMQNGCTGFQCRARERFFEKTGFSLTKKLNGPSRGVFWDCFWEPFRRSGPPLGPLLLPTFPQNGAERPRGAPFYSFASFWVHVGSILGPFWVDLGSVSKRFGLKNNPPAFRKFR